MREGHSGLRPHALLPAADGGYGHKDRATHVCRSTYSNAAAQTLACIHNFHNPPPATPPPAAPPDHPRASPPPCRPLSCCSRRFPAPAQRSGPRTIQEAATGPECTQRALASSRASCVKPEPPRAISPLRSSLSHQALNARAGFLSATLNSRKIRLANSALALGPSTDSRRQPTRIQPTLSTHSGMPRSRGRRTKRAQRGAGLRVNYSVTLSYELIPADVCVKT